MSINSFLCKFLLSDKMNSRNMILSGALVVLVALLTTSSVYAGETDIGAGPVDEHPQVYLIKKVLDICDPDEGGHLSDSDALPGGSMPPSGQQFGCVKIIGDRFNEYLFTGEQVGTLVAVRHTNGVEAIASPVVLEVDGEVKVLCNDITGDYTYLPNGSVGVQYSYDWFGHDIEGDLLEQPPAKSAGTPQGFNLAYDKLFQCIYTATEDDVGLLPVEVVATDEDGDEGRGALDFIWFNPEILVDVTTSDGGPISFADGSSGQTVYSTNHLIVTNEAEGGVILFVWIAGSDLVSSEGPAKCPDTNVLESDNIEYRCKIGSLFGNEWEDLDNPDDTLSCKFWNSNTECQNSESLLGEENGWPFNHLSFLTVGSWAECWFRLTYPTPCIGLFDQGTIYIFARAV